MTDIQKAISILQAKEISCALVRDSVAAQSELSGILPLLTWLEGDPNALRDSNIADRVVGKAAALLMVFGNVKEVYAGVISALAEEVFIKNKISYSYGEKTDFIWNRDRTGMCPMEQRCMEIESPQEAYQVLNEMVRSRSSKS